MTPSGPKGYVLSGGDRKQLDLVVRDFRSRPPRLPVAEGKHVKTTARVVVFELISETPDGDGLFDIYIMERQPGGGYQAVSTVKVKLEDLNA